MTNKRQYRKFIIRTAGILVLFVICLGFSVFAQNKKTFTEAELARYNGQNGNPAYVAVNGVIYDVTKLPSWAGGRHFCPSAFAGKDLTPLWNLVPSSHRRPSFLQQFPVIGRLVAAQPQSTAEKAAEQTFTPQELAKYNGKNGAKAYVAVKGIVYDLTDVPEWAGGKHFCAQAIAGNDITFLWNLVPPSHHNPNFLKRFHAVGRLVAANSKPSSTAPGTPNSGTSSLAGILLIGFGIALVSTLLWFGIRFKRKKT